MSTEATTVFELVSRTPEAGFEVVAPDIIISESMRKSVTRMYSDTAFSQPSENEKLTTISYWKHKEKGKDVAFYQDGRSWGSSRLVSSTATDTKNSTDDRSEAAPIRLSVED